jgi:hypothetical protein
MLFSIFLVILALSFIFMVLGYFINFPVMSLFGALLLFGLGLTMLNVGIDVKTGDVTNITYDGTVASSLTSTDTYEVYDFGSIGTTPISILFLILGTFLFVLFIFRLGD